MFNFLKKKKQEEEREQRSSAFIEGTENLLKPYEYGNPLEGLHPVQGMQSNLDKDLQLILSKLDVINAKLDNLNKRLEILERIAHQSTQQVQQLQSTQQQPLDIKRRW